MQCCHTPPSLALRQCPAAAAVMLLLCLLPPLQLRRPMEQLDSMVNQRGDSGSDAPPHRARALNTSDIVVDMDIVEESDDKEKQPVPNPKRTEKFVPEY